MGLLEGVVGAAERGSMGQAIARRFRDEGAQVLVASRRVEACRVFADEVGGYAASCDLTVRDDVFTLADIASQQMGGVDIAINSTGLALGAPFLEFNENDLHTLIALQFKGAFFFLQAMMNGGGSIIQNPRR